MYLEISKQLNKGYKYIVFVFNILQFIVYIKF